jgi:dolichol-phosphate mannosyltransferase
MENKQKPVYSIVVPVFNEEECVTKFYEAMVPVMEQTGEPFEIIYVNDGSRDKTEENVTAICQKDARVRLINFSRNFGQQAAIHCGFTEAKGDAVIDIDVDLQDPPEAVLDMIAKWKEGYEVVHGKRQKRKGETFFKKFTSTLYTKFLKKITGLDIPASVGDFKLFDRKVIETYLSMTEHHRFLRGMTAWMGFKQTEVEFLREARAAGKTKYSIKKLVRLAEDGIVANSNYPLSLAMKFGIALGVLSVACFIAFPLLLIWSINVGLTAYLFPTIGLATAALLVSNGLTNLYLARVYDEVKNRPRYIVGSRIN